MNLPSGTVTFLFTDIEGSTRLWEDKPDAMREALALHNQILRAAITARNGYVFKTIGDAFQAAFAQASDGVAAALDAQLELARARWGTTGPLRVRMGVHIGGAEAQEGDYATTPTLNRVARLMSAGHGEQILLSHPVVELVRGHLPPGADLRDLGWHRLKDLARAEQIFQLTHPELRADFPPLRSVDAFPNNLPIQLNSFVGRAREIAQVKELLSAPTTRLVTLTGPGGSGKTRLAIQVAGELVEEFHDGVWLIELAALTDPAFIVPHIATVLGVREERGEALIDAVCNYLKALRVLIVLDNCEHLIDSTAEVTETLLGAANDLKILATSQELLRLPGERVFAVPSLSLPNGQTRADNEHLQAYEAIRLFVERANGSNPTFALNEHNAPLVVQVCQRLDGIPLALELAASRLRVLTIDQIASRLDDRFRLLTAGSRTAAPRHQTLRATMDWSYDLCPEAERMMWRRIAVFARGFTLEAAEAVVSDAQIPTSQVLDLLNALVDRSLVLTDEGDEQVRYHLLSTIQEYGRYRLVESGETQMLRDRHRDFFAALAARAEPELRRSEQALWLDRLEAELDNLRVAMEWSLESKDGESVFGIAGALAYFWLIRAHLTEGKTWLTRALAVSQTPTALRSKALNSLGVLAYTQGDYAAADEAYRETLAIRRELGDKPGLVQVLNNLGGIASIQGNLQRSKDYFEEALIIQRELPKTPLLAVLLSNLGEIFVQLGAHEQAQNLFVEALSLQRESGDKWGMAYTHANLGEAAESRGDLNLAREQYETSLALRQEIGDKLGIGIMKSNLGHVAIHQNDFTRAQTLLSSSLAALNEIGDRQMVLTVLQYFSELWMSQSQLFAPAVETMSAIKTLRESMGAPLAPLMRGEFESNLNACRAHMSEVQFELAWERGRGMTIEQAIALALTER